MSDVPKSSKIGNNVVLEEGVTIGEKVVIGHNTIILKGTDIGNNVEIGSNCVLGIQPSGNQRMRKIDESSKQLIIKNGTRIGHGVSIYSGTIISQNVFIGDQASIRENVSVSEETVIGRAAIIELNSTIGKRCTIQTLAYVTGDTILEDNVFIGPCVSMSNDKYMGAEEYTLKGPIIKEGAKIGNNASLLPGIIIGRESIVGAGSVVTKNINNYEIVAGVPARRIRS
ncbi:N-acetyltransferase [Priestia megaterium]|uniref:N-acetyltransferase n=1 Tax=Priestia megaterium TaxID=1404 RepID=UPI00203BDAE0|nr:N-acetyltransferase [Priestia megaterium]MCM3100040.1 N-acetyltransferase [Priestia megaterium]